MGALPNHAMEQSQHLAARAYLEGLHGWTPIRVDAHLEVAVRIDAARIGVLREERPRRASQAADLAVRRLDDRFDAAIRRLHALSTRMDLRCKRPDGTYYGTSGQCRKGKQAEAKAVTRSASKGRRAKTSHSPLQGAASTGHEKPKLASRNRNQNPTKPARIASGGPMTRDQIKKAFEGFDAENLTRESMQALLGRIYAARGYNAKPEVVDSESALRRRKDTLRNDTESEGLVIYRGLTDSSHVAQFRGEGEAGEVHYPGLGVYGNGTYAAGPRDIGTPSQRQAAREKALKTALSYAGVSRKEQKAGAGLDRVAAISIKADANVLRMPGTDYKNAADKIQKEASTLAGFKVQDTGVAAAILGYDAYEFGVSRTEAYWVILNRGALIISSVDARS